MFIVQLIIKFLFFSICSTIYDFSTLMSVHYKKLLHLVPALRAPSAPISPSLVTWLTSPPFLPTLNARCFLILSPRQKIRNFLLTCPRFGIFSMFITFLKSNFRPFSHESDFHLIRLLKDCKFAPIGPFRSRFMNFSKPIFCWAFKFSTKTFLITWFFYLI